MLPNKAGITRMISKNISFCLYNVLKLLFSLMMLINLFMKNMSKLLFKGSVENKIFLILVYHKTLKIFVMIQIHTRELPQ